MKHVVRAIVIQECDRVFVVEADSAEEAAAQVEDGNGELAPYGETGCITNVEVWDNTPLEELDSEDKEELEKALNKKKS